MEEINDAKYSNLSWKENLGFKIKKSLVEPEFEAMSKRFSNTSRFVVSSQVWTNMIPTRDCDILITFPKNTDDDTLMWILSRLKSRAPELSVHVRHHSNTGVYGFYLTTSFDNLLKGAEEISIRKPVKMECGGGMKDFQYSDQEYFEGIEDPKAFFTSQERQSIVKQMVDNVRAQDGDILGKLKFLEGQAMIPILISKEIVKDILPLHNNDDISYLRKNWVQAIFRSQPLERIKDYFGLKIAMYFAYLGHYTKSLIFPTVIGIALWIMSGKDQYTDDLFFVIFAFINVLWATLYLESWKRTSAEHAYNWGVDVEDELLVEPRPLYHGSIIKSKVTGRYEPHYPAWKRNMFRYFVSGPIILFCLCVVFSVMWAIFALQDWINSQVAKENLPSPCKFIPKIMLAVSIGVLDDIYKKIAYWLNDKENYRLEETYENNLIIKLVLFQFVNSFLSLFYIAFYLRDMDRLKDQLAALLITRQVIGNIKEAFLPFVLEKVKLFKMGYNMTKDMSRSTLDKQAKEIIDKKLKISCPIDAKADKEKQSKPSTSGVKEMQPSKEEIKETKEANCDVTQQDVRPKRESIKNFLIEDVTVGQGGPHLTQAEVEAAMKPYEDTFEDHLEMFIQFGYVTLFSSAFPLAALCAILNNVIEIRSDAFKLCTSMQRPFGQRVPGIGTWQDALELMSMIAVMVNCAMIGYSDFADRMFPDYTPAQRVIFVVLLEHIILSLKMMLAYAIPDLPDWVAEEKARLEYLRREALKKLETKNTSNTISPSKADPSETDKFMSKVNTYVKDYVGSQTMKMSGSAKNELAAQSEYPKLTLYSYKNYLNKEPKFSSSSNVQPAAPTSKELPHTSGFPRTEYYYHTKPLVAVANNNYQAQKYRDISRSYESISTGTERRPGHIRTVVGQPYIATGEKSYVAPTGGIAPRSTFSSTWSESKVPPSSAVRTTTEGSKSSLSHEAEASIDTFMNRYSNEPYNSDPGHRQGNLLTQYCQGVGSNDHLNKPASNDRKNTSIANQQKSNLNDDDVFVKEENLLTRYCKGIVSDDTPNKYQSKSSISSGPGSYVASLPVSSTLVSSIQEKSKQHDPKEIEYREQRSKQIEERIMNEYRETMQQQSEKDKKETGKKERSKTPPANDSNSNSSFISKVKDGLTKRRSSSKKSTADS